MVKALTVNRFIRYTCFADTAVDNFCDSRKENSNAGKVFFHFAKVSVYLCMSHIRFTIYAFREDLQKKIHLRSKIYFLPFQTCISIESSERICIVKTRLWSLFSKVSKT